MNPEHFRLHEVAAGVWAAESDFTGIAIGNAAIIDAGGKTIVVDTFWTDVAAEELRRTAEELTGNAVHLAVNSHWHGDHTNGNQAFENVPIVSTTGTRDAIAETAPKDIEAWRSEIAESMAALEQQAGDDPTAARRLESMTTFHGFAGRYRPILPTILFDDHLVVEGERTVEITTHGRGHTVSDVIVWVPEVGVLVTGDLAWNGVHPRMNDGFPLDWAAYAERLIELAPSVVIAGHGPPGGTEVLEPLPSYFREVESMVEAVRSGTEATAVDSPTAGAEWADLARFHASLEALATR